MKKRFCILLLAWAMVLTVMSGMPVSAQTESNYASQIAAAANTDFSFERGELFQSLAQKPDLTQADQTYLIEAILANPGYSSDTAEILTALANNPATTRQTKDMIASRIEKFNLFSSDQSTITQILIDGGRQPAAQRTVESTATTSDIFNAAEMMTGRGQPTEGPPLFMVVGMLVLVLAVLGLMIAYLLTLSNCLKKVKEHNRAMSPGMVYLLLIPLFNIGWNFYVVLKIRDSLAAEFKERAIEEKGDFGYAMGLAMAILSAAGLIPFLGSLTGLPGFIVWIIYWIQISGYSKKLGC